MYFRNNRIFAALNLNIPYPFTARSDLYGPQYQWVDLGTQPGVCMIRPLTCSAAGGAISVWVNVMFCGIIAHGGIISSYSLAAEGLVIYCDTNRYPSSLAYDFCLLPAVTKLAKVMFLQVYVCPQGVHRVGLPQCMLGYQPPRKEAPPGRRHPPEGGSPQEQTPQEGGTPLGRRHPTKEQTQ